MNQLTQPTERLPMDQVGMSTGSTGAKIAPQNLGEVVKFAEVMCRADIAIPKHLRNNAGACMAVAMQALEWQMSPFAVASKSYEVQGRIAYEAQLIAAVVNTRSGIKGRLRYKYDGEGATLTCTVTGILDGEECVYTSPTMGSITTKNSPLWKSDPQQQLGYFAARSWARRHCPEVILGVYDRDEVEEFRGPDNARDVTPKTSLADRLSKASSAPQRHADANEGFSATYVAEEPHDALTGEIMTDSVDAEIATPDNKPTAPIHPVETVPAALPDDVRQHLIDLSRKTLTTLNADGLDNNQKSSAIEDMLANYRDAIDEQYWPKMSTIRVSALAIMNGKRTQKQFAAFMAEMLDCSVAEIGGA